MVGLKPGKAHTNPGFIPWKKSIKTGKQKFGAVLILIDKKNKLIDAFISSS